MSAKYDVWATEVHISNSNLIPKSSLILMIFCSLNLAAYLGKICLENVLGVRKKNPGWTKAITSLNSIDSRSRMGKQCIQINLVMISCNCYFMSIEESDFLPLSAFLWTNSLRTNDLNSWGISSQLLTCEINRYSFTFFHLLSQNQDMIS